MKPFAPLAVALALLASPAQAQLFGIRSCDIFTTGLAFGGFSGAQVDRTGTLAITCDGTGTGNLVSIALSQGVANSFTPRQMSAGINRLSYNLYLDPARTIIWGSGIGATQLRFATYDLRFFSPVRQTFTVFGRIPVQPTPRPGHYSDLLIVTVFF